MQKNTILIISIAIFIISFGAGYLVGGSRGYAQDVDMNIDQHDHSSHIHMSSDVNPELKTKAGNNFDQVFLTEMIIHHQGAIEMAQLALTNAYHQEIKDLAKEIISAQNKEIIQMKMWQSEWER